MFEALKTEEINDLLRLTDDGYLFHRESQELEFKEQFNLAGLKDYASIVARPLLEFCLLGMPSFGALSLKK